MDLAKTSNGVVTFLLVKVVGIPMFEIKYTGRSDWEAYMKRTITFIV